MKRIWPIPLALFTIAFVILIQHDPAEKYEGPADNLEVVADKIVEDLATIAPEPVVEEAPAILVRENVKPEKELEVLPAPIFEGSAITIEVWDHAARQAVPFAHVLLEPEGRSGSVYQNANGFRDYLLEHSEVYSCDEKGQLRVPRDWLLRWAGAESGALWGAARLLESEYRNTVRIPVTHNRSLQVKVVNAVGEPMEGTAVHLAVGSRGALNSARNAITDARGIATLHQVSDFSHSGRGVEGYVLLAGSPPPPFVPRAALQPLSAIPDFSTLVLPPSGQLQARLLGLDGEPISGTSKVTLRLVASGQNPAEKTRSKVNLASLSNESGLYSFPAVAPGYSMNLQVDFEGIGDFETFILEPLKENEVRKIDLRQTHIHPTMVFEAVDLDARPLANTDLDLKVRADVVFQGWVTLQSLRVTTDEYGRASFPLAQARMAMGDNVMRVRELIATAPAEESQRSDFGVLDLSRAFDPGTTELGQLVIEPPEKIAYGQVVDAIGKPVVGVRVKVSSTTSVQDSAGTWSQLDRTYGDIVKTGDDGSFIIFGKRPTDDTNVKIKAWRTGYVHSPGPYLGHDTAHNLLMNGLKGGNQLHIQGEVLLPEGFESAGVIVEYQPNIPTDGGNKGASHSTSREGGLFRIRGLSNQLGTLTVGIGSAWPFRVLATLENVNPWAVGKEGDPRLAPLDLREVLNRFELLVVDESGIMIPNIKLMTVRKRSNGGTSTSTLSSVDGYEVFLAGGDTYALTITASGYRSADIVLQDASTTLTMQRALPAKFKLSWMPPLADLRFVVLGLNPVDGGSSTKLIDPVRFNENGELLTNVSRPGRYEVSLGIFVSGGTTSTRLRDETGTALIIEIGDEGEIQNFQFHPPQDFFDGLLLPADLRE